MILEVVQVHDEYPLQRHIVVEILGEKRVKFVPPSLAKISLSLSLSLSLTYNVVLAGPHLESVEEPQREC